MRSLLLALLLSTPLVASAAPARKGADLRLRAGTPAASSPATEADVRQLLRDWEAFQRAVAGLHDVPGLPAAGDEPQSLSAADAAWAADARVRRALEASGTTPERFLESYRKVAEAWWTLREREARSEAAAALRAQVEELRREEGEGAREIREELERGLRVLEADLQRASPGVDAVRPFRDDLARIFAAQAPAVSPGAAGP